MDDVEMEEVDEMLATIERLKARDKHAEAEIERLREEAAERELILAGCEAMIRDLRAEVELLRVELDK
jgi:chromosome segregation ATPase